MPRRRKKPNWPTEIAGYPITDCEGKYYYDEEAANAPIVFAEDCFTHIKGQLAGEPFVFENWMVPVTQTLFGWKRKSDDYRRFRRAYLQLARKQSKTTWLAAIAEYMLFADGEPGAEIYVAAKDADQARFLYDLVYLNISEHPLLSSRCQIRKSEYRIAYGHSYIRAIPADEEGIHGANAHFVACDELFAWQKPGMYEALATSVGTRRQPMIIAITTAGFDRGSLCYQQYKFACRVRDGVTVDEQFLPVIFEVPERVDWRDREHWHLANPMLGVSIMPEFLETEYQYALQNPRFEGNFRRLYLNQWTQAETSFLQMIDWRDCPTDNEPIPKGAEVIGGLDLSGTKDLTAFCLIYLQPDGTLKLRWKYWMPQADLDLREKRDGVPYRQWAKEGWIELCPTSRVNYDMVEQDIMKMCEPYNVLCIGYDAWSAMGIVQRLEGEGLECAQVGMGYAAMNEPMLLLEQKVSDHTIDHGGNPVSEWCAECLVAHEREERVRPVKPEYREENKRIDGIVATLIALHPYIRLEIEEKNIYSEREPLVFEF